MLPVHFTQLLTYQDGASNRSLRDDFDHAVAQSDGMARSNDKQCLRRQLLLCSGIRQVPGMYDVCMLWLTGY